MSIIINDQGGLEVGPPDDPVRKANADLVDRLAWHLECQLQADEFFSETVREHKQQIAGLTARVAFLEALLAGQAAAA